MEEGNILRLRPFSYILRIDVITIEQLKSEMGKRGGGKLRFFCFSFPTNAFRVIVLEALRGFVMLQKKSECVERS